MIAIILLIITIFGLLLSIFSILMLAVDDTHENLKTSLVIIGMVLMMLGAGVGFYTSNKEKHTVVITTGTGEDIYTDCRVIVTEQNHFTKIVIETNDEEQIVYLNPIKYEVK